MTSSFRAASPFTRRPSAAHDPPASATTPSRAPARRLLTPSFSRLRQAAAAVSSSSTTASTTTASTATTSTPVDSSRFGFTAFRNRHRAAPAPAPAYHTPEQPGRPSAPDPFDEDKISKTPAKDRNDEWLASLGFDLEVLKLSAHREPHPRPATDAENRNPNIFDSDHHHHHRHDHRSPASKLTPRRLAMPRRTLTPRPHRPLREPSAAAVTPPVPREGHRVSLAVARIERALSADAYPDSSVSTDFVEHSSSAVNDEEANEYAGHDVRNLARVFSSPPAVGVEDTSPPSPSSEASLARSSTPPHEPPAAVDMPPSRRTDLPSEGDSVFRTPPARQPSSMRGDVPIARPATTIRRHTDFQPDSGSMAMDSTSTGMDAAITPCRVRSARKSRRASARVSVRELRALIEAQGSMGITVEPDADSRPRSVRKTRTRQSVVKTDGSAGVKDPAPENLPTANFVLTPVRATRQQKEALGSEQIVTPVRRSLRISKRHMPIVDIDDVGEHNAKRLESADYAFLPNRNLKEKVDVDRKNVLR